MSFPRLSSIWAIECFPRKKKRKKTTEFLVILNGKIVKGKALSVSVRKNIVNNKKMPMS